MNAETYDKGINSINSEKGQKSKCDPMISKVKGHKKTFSRWLF